MGYNNDIRVMFIVIMMPEVKTDAALLAEHEPEPDLEPENDNDSMYNVEMILDERELPDGTTEYFIKWEGYSRADATWEPESIITCPELIEQFHKRADRAKRRESGTNPTSGGMSGSNSRNSRTTAKRTSIRSARKESGSPPKPRGRLHKKTSNTHNSTNDEPVPYKKRRRSGRLRTYESELSDVLQPPSIDSPSRESSTEPKPHPRKSDRIVQSKITSTLRAPVKRETVAARLPAAASGRRRRTQLQPQTSSTRSPSREPSPVTNRRDRSLKSDRIVQPMATPTIQSVQQLQQVQTPARRPILREPSTESNVTTTNATAIGDIREEDGDRTADNIVDLVYPNDNCRVLELCVNTNLLKLNEPVMLVRKNFGRLPVEVYMNVFSESGEEKLAVIVKCNNGIRSNLWKAHANIDITLLSGPAIDTMCHLFRWGKSSCDIGLPVSLAEVLHDDSPYIDRRGIMAIQVKIQLEKVDGYMQPFSTNFFSQPHPHLTNATIIVKGKIFHVDSFLLCKSSPVFYEAFYGHNKKKSSVIVSDCTPVEFQLFLTKVYFPTERIKMNCVINLLRLAYRFEVGYIIENCLEFMKGNAMPLDVKCKALELSDKLGDAELQNYCMETILKEGLLEGVIKSVMYDDLSPEYKVLLLSRATKEQSEKVIEIE